MSLGSSSYTQRVMNALGAISSFDRYNALYQLSLEREVSTVSREEAESGLSQSDQFRATTKATQGEERPTTLAGYLQRSRALNLQQPKTGGGKTSESASESCPIAQARSRSVVGENAPLNWLVADQMGGYASAPQAQDFCGAAETPLQSQEALVVASPEPDASLGGTLLSQEWLLTPCH